MSSTLANDFSSIEGIQRKRLLTFVNHYVIQMTSFLSDFSSQCDLKLIRVGRKLASLETSLLLLEQKLDSLPQLK